MVAWILPASTAAIAAVFGTAVLLRYLDGRKTHNFLWTLGLYGIAGAALTQAAAALSGSWSDPLFRGYYFLIAPPVMALGAGTIYLLKQQAAAKYFLWATLGLTAADALVCAATTINVERLAASGTDAGTGIASGPMIAVAIIMNTAGALALGAGAVISFLATKRRHNLLILAGTAVFASGGSIARAFPQGEVATWAVYIGNLIGIALLFSGFLLSRATPSEAPSPAPGTAQAPPA